MISENGEHRFGFVAILGATNAGKSTLVNQCVGAKVTIVTPKVQTTRSRVLGIGIQERSQIVFVDTPGIFEPTRRLERAMVRAAWQGANHADWVVAMVDAARDPPSDASLRIIDGLVALDRSATLVLNKIDLIRRDRLLALSETLNSRGRFADTFMVSALSGDGVADLKQALADRMPPGLWHYPEEQLADMPERLLAAEITREQVFLRLHQELPYAITVETEQWTPFEDGGVRIDQVVYVMRDGQKGIVLGKGGQTIKAIGASARAALREALERDVHLFLRVKVRARWQDDPERYREMGLDYID